MKGFPTLLALLLTSSIFVKADEIKTSDGEVLKDVTVISKDSVSLSVSTGDGIRRIPMAQLTPELQTKYGYSLELATKQVEAEANAATLKKSADSMKAFDRLSATVKVTVHQVVESGILCRIDTFSMWEEGRKPTMKALYGSTNPWGLERSGERNGMIFLCGTFPTLADWDRWGGRIWPAGTYSYGSVGAGQLTIKRFATTREEALRLLQESK